MTEKTDNIKGDIEDENLTIEEMKEIHGWLEFNIEYYKQKEKKNE